MLAVSFVGGSSRSLCMVPYAGASIETAADPCFRPMHLDDCGALTLVCWFVPPACLSLCRTVEV